MKKTLLLLLTAFTVTIYADDFFTDFDTEEAAAAVEINGEVNLGLYSVINDDDLEDSTIENITDATFTTKYSGSDADVTVVAEVKTNSINLEECYTNIYFDYFTLDAGLFKTVWGKGDKLHVVDVLNPLDFSNYFENDYIDNKIAQPTLKANIQLGMNGMLEVAYVPTFESDNIPTDGMWQPKESKRLDEYVAKMRIATSNDKYELPFENRDGVVKNSQAGVRFTNSINGFDFGLLYYHGFYKRPLPIMNGELIEKMVYPTLDMIGIEFGKVLYGFNLRGEAAYYIVEDLFTTNMNSINYVAGFDRNLPINNVNLNIQVKGNYIPDANENETNNLLVSKISDTYNHEKVEVSLTNLYVLEDNDYMLKPEVIVKVGDNIELSANATFFEGDDDTFLGQFDDNDSLSFNIKYNF